MKTIKLLIIAVLFTAINIPAQQSSKLKAFYESISMEKIGNYNAAIAALEKNYSNEKNDYLYNLRLGWLYYLKGDFKKSVEFYNNSIRISHESTESLLGITYPYAKMNRKNKLKDVYKEILNNDKNNYTANLNLALIYFNEGDYLNAIIFLEKNSKNYPSDFTTNLYLGWATYYVGGNKKAHAYFEKALIASPNNPSALKGYNATK